MITKIFLKHFAITGKFGPITVGMTKNEVIQLLGEPEEDRDFGTGSSGLYYGWYEIFYDSKTEVINAIQNDHLQAHLGDNSEAIHFKNDLIEIDTWFVKPDSDITFSEVTNILNKESISYKQEEYWGNEIIRFESGVYLGFDNRNNIWEIDQNGEIQQHENAIIENKEHFVLNGIRYFPQHHQPK